MNVGAKKFNKELQEYEQYLISHHPELLNSTIRTYVRVVRRFLTGTISRVSGGYATIMKAALKKYNIFRGGKYTNVINNYIGKHSIERSRRIELPVARAVWEQMYEIAKKYPSPLCHILQMIMYSGLRCTDVGNIQREDVEEAQKTGILYCTFKGGRREEYPWAGLKQFLEPLLKYKWNVLYECISPTYQAYYMRLYRLTKEIAEKLNIDRNIHPHLFRRTIAHYLLASGEDIETVRRILRHRSIETTRRYTESISGEEYKNVFDKLDKLRFTRRKK